MVAQDRCEAGALGAPAVRFENVTLGYGNRTVLSGLNFQLGKGGYVGIVGPNGAGKTTLLRAILGTLRPLSGRVVRDPDLSIGYVPQAQTLNEHFPLSALDVVLMGRYRLLGVGRRPSRKDRAACLEVMEQVGVQDLAGRPFRDLSGGQKQRVLVARALASGPAALVLDEPTSGMDVAAEQATMELLDRLHDQRGLLLLMVSHTLNVVVNHAQQVAIMGESGLTLGSVDEMVKAERLQEVYGTSLTVGSVNGKRVVL